MLLIGVPASRRSPEMNSRERGNDLSENNLDDGVIVLMCRIPEKYF
jgi:hypothetical protein